MKNALMPTFRPLDPALCYPALQAKDARFDGRFFVCVTSTGVYCRPICPARTPRKEHCTFVASAAAAEALGFRSCLRCRPETAPGTPAWSGTQASVARALRLIEDGALDKGNGSVGALAARVGMGERQLRRLFVRHVGANPQAVAANRRLLAAKQLISDTHMPMSEIAFAAGYRSLRRFNDAVRANYGMEPMALRRRAAKNPPGETIALRLGYRPPFDWERLLAYLSMRAIPGIEEIVEGRYRRTFRVAEATGIVEAAAITGRNALEIRIRVQGHAARHTPIRAIAARMRRLFDLDADPAAIIAAFTGDALLAPLIGRAAGIRVPGAFDGFELAVRAILGQQVSVKGATTLAGRLVRCCGEALAAPEGSLTHVFPAPQTLRRTDLSGLGLTGARIATLKALAGTLDREELALEPGASLEGKIAELTALPGIGEWTAHYIALRALGEPDAFPSADLGLRKAAGDGTPISAQALKDMAEAWRPWRGYAALLLWTEPGEAPEGGAE